LEKPVLYTVIAGIAVGMAALAFFAFGRPATDPVALADCLSAKGWTMYGTEWCSHCNAQKEAFGEAFAKVDFVDCDEKPFECQENGVDAYPSWVNRDGSRHLVGEQSLDVLASEAGCVS